MSHISLKVERKLGNKDKKSNLKAGVTKLCFTAGLSNSQTLCPLILNLNTIYSSDNPSNKYKYLFDTAKSNDSFRSFAHYFNIWPDSIYIFPFANDVASTAISFPLPKVKRKQLMYLLYAVSWRCAKIMFRENQ